MPTSDLSAGPRAYAATYEPYRNLAGQIFQTGAALEHTAGAVGDFMKARNKEKYRLAALQELQAQYPHVKVDQNISLEDLARGLYQLGVVKAYYDKAKESNANLVNPETLDNMAFQSSQEGTMTLVKGLDDARQLAEGKTVEELYGSRTAEVAKGGVKTEQEIAGELTKPIVTADGKTIHMPIKAIGEASKVLGTQAPVEKTVNIKSTYYGLKDKGAAGGKGATGELTQKDIVNNAREAAKLAIGSNAKAAALAQKAQADLFMKPIDKKAFLEAGIDPIAFGEYVKWAVASMELGKPNTTPKTSYDKGIAAWSKLAKGLGVDIDEAAADSVKKAEALENF